MSDAGAKNFIELTASIVSAYLGNNPTPAAEIPNLISQVHGALVRVSSGRVEAAPLEPAKPAVSLKKSIAPDYLVCLEDGKRFKSLKRHLRTQYNMTPEQYREKWGLPADYPMVAPNYAVARSQLAKQSRWVWDSSSGSGSRAGLESRRVGKAKRAHHPAHNC
ncbi:UNVERIFIED_ORG: putative transcriptional regulator [Bradyrhizobium japonicum]